MSDISELKGDIYTAVAIGGGWGVWLPVEGSCSFATVIFLRA